MWGYVENIWHILRGWYECMFNMLHMHARQVKLACFCLHGIGETNALSSLLVIWDWSVGSLKIVYICTEMLQFSVLYTTNCTLHRCTYNVFWVSWPPPRLSESAPQRQWCHARDSERQLWCDIIIWALSRTVYFTRIANLKRLCIALMVNNHSLAMEWTV